MILNVKLKCVIQQSYGFASLLLTSAVYHICIYLIFDRLILVIKLSNIWFKGLRLKNIDLIKCSNYFLKWIEANRKDSKHLRGPYQKRSPTGANISGANETSRSSILKVLLYSSLLLIWLWIWIIKACSSRQRSPSA